MLRFALLPLLALIVWTAGVSAADAPVPAGRVRFVEGDVRFVDAAQRVRRPVVGDRVHAADTVVAGRDGEVHLEMEDSGYVAVRPNTRLTIVEFRARGDRNDRSILRLLEGTFRAITGWIPRVAPKSYRVETLTATIGVRGTDHEPLFLPEGSLLGEPGTYDKVNEGATVLEDRSGVLDVAKNAVGFSPLGRRTKSRLLERIPEFFRPTRNEDLLAGRHQAIQERLEEKLEERRRLERDPADRDADGRDSAPKKLEPPGGGLGEGAGAAVPGAALPAAGGGVPSTGVSSVPLPTVPVPPVPLPVPTPDIPLPSLPGGASDAPPPKAVPAAPPSTQDSESPSRALPGSAAPAASAVKPDAPAAKPATEDRSKALSERRRRQLEDPKAQYERDRQIQSDRDLTQGRDAERDAQRRRRDQR